MSDSPGLKDFVGAAADLGVQVTANEPLARHTSFRIGGPADLYATATTTTQLENLAALATERSIPITILGGGSNVLVSDAGVRGLVIANHTSDKAVRTGAPQPHGLPSAEGRPYLVVDSGVLLAGLARWAIKNGWAGLEWAISIPGTVGGAVVGNAGAHGGDMAGSVAWVLIAHPCRERQVLPVDALAYTYRGSRLRAELVSGSAEAGGLVQRSDPVAGTPAIILTAGFHAVPGDVAEMTARAESYLTRRRATQPIEPSAGSIFRNPPGDYAGRLVEAAKLKGYQIGGAQVSPRHANFIINRGHACAADVIGLMNLMRRRVHDMTGIVLLPEILFLGDWIAQPLCSP